MRVVIAAAIGLGSLAPAPPSVLATSTAPSQTVGPPSDDHLQRAPITPAPPHAQPLPPPPAGVVPRPGAVSALSTSPCTTTTLDAKLLVLSGDGQEPALGAIRQALDGMGTPYSLWVATQKPGQLTPEQLSGTCHGYYQGIILTNGSLGYQGPSGWVDSALTSTEWQNLQAYEGAFHVRVVSWYSYPTPDAGFNWPSAGVDTTSTSLATHLTPQGQAVFGYVQPGATIPIQGAWAYLATPLSDGATTTLLADGQGHALAAVRAYADGHQLLSLTFDDNQDLIQDLVLWYGFITWVTNGVFLGQRQTYLSPQVDDLFHDGAMWLPTQTCGQPTSNQSYRTTGADLQALLTWQRSVQAASVSRQLTVGFAFIGWGAQPGSYVPDTLTPVVQATAPQFRWINHTYTHPDFDTIDYATALSQVTQNDAVATQLGLTPFSPQNLVTPAYTGLTNPAAMQAVYDAGVRNIATDTLRPGYSNPTPNAGLPIQGSYQGKTYQLFGVPRLATNLYYNVSTPDQWLAGDHCLYPAGQWGYAATYADLLARESGVMLRYLLWGNVDAIGYHQLNIRAYDGVHSLLSDLLSQTLQQYNALVTFPIVSLTMDGIAARMADRMQWDTARPQVSASLITSSTGTVLQLSSPVAVSVPLTGVAVQGAQEYGQSLQSHVTLSAGGSVTLPVSAATRSSGAPIQLLGQPTRLVDTRSAGGPIQPGADRCFMLAGQGGIPTNATGVVLNLTASGATARGWLTLYPAGQAVPASSTLNFDPSEHAIANGAIVRLGAGGQVCVDAGQASTNVILDATGYVTSSSTASLPLLDSPVRLVDTRSNGGPIQPGADRCFTLAGQGGIPTTAAGVLLNVTGVGYTAAGWLTVYPAGQSLPASSSLNFDPHEWAIANNMLVKLGSGGQVCVDTGQAASQVILDAVGYVTSAGLAQVPLLSSPVRLVDTRSNGGPIQPGADRCFTLAGQGGIPTTASGVLLNVTATGQTAAGWLTVYPAGQPLPATSTVNFNVTEYAIANGATVRLGSGGQVCVHTGEAAAQVLLDATGYLP